MDSAIPRYDEDLFSDEAIRDPYPHYRRVRDLGPVVWLSGAAVHAVTRYDDVRAVLADAETFSSGQGVLFNDTANTLTRGTILASDDPEHDRLRKVVAHRLTPRALRGERDGVTAKAVALADRLVAASQDGSPVDGVADIAEAMPMSVVPDFLGFPEDCHDKLLIWAGGAIDSGGPPSERTPHSVALAQEVGAYIDTMAATRSMRPGSLAADLAQAADDGTIRQDQCPALLIDYFGPSLETTVSALGAALELFARFPEQWELLRRDPTLVAGAFNEVVRLESPLRAFTRVATVDTEVGGTPVPAGTRLAVFYASANRDERVWDHPDDFDILRDNAHHLGLGHGVHGCAGQGLSRMEIGALLTELGARVERIELVGEPTRRISSLLRAWERLPLRLHLVPAAPATAAPATAAGTAG